jgi:thioredoxin 1
MLVDFWAEWCGSLPDDGARVEREVADELTGNLHVGKVNIEQYQSFARKYNVRSIPTMILFKKAAWR